MPGWPNMGPTSHTRSTYRIARTKSASCASSAGRFLMSRDSKRRNGSAKCPSSTSTDTYCQPDRRLAAVLLCGPFVEQHRTEQPDAEVQHGPRDEKRHVEVRRLDLQHLVRADGCGARPREQRRQTEQERNERQCDKRQRAARGFEDPPADEPPLPTRQVLEHQQRER